MKTIAELTAGKLIVEFCEPCGDAAPGLPHAASDGLYAAVEHTYVQTSPTRYENLARLLGRPADGVSPSLDVVSETATGVLILPSQHPPAAVIERPADLPDLASGAAAGAGAVGFGLGVAMALALVRRRRRTMRPRAIDLR